MNERFPKEGEDPEVRIKLGCGCLIPVSRGTVKAGGNWVPSMRWQDVDIEAEQIEYCRRHDGERLDQIRDVAEASLDGGHDASCPRDASCRCVRDGLLDIVALASGV